MSWLRGNGKVRKDQTDHYGRVKGDGGAKISDFQDSGSILVEQDASTKKIFFELDDSILEDSTTIKIIRDLVTGKISFKLDVVEETEFTPTWSSGITGATLQGTKAYLLTPNLAYVVFEVTGLTLTANTEISLMTELKVGDKKIANRQVINCINSKTTNVVGCAVDQSSTTIYVNPTADVASTNILRFQGFVHLA